MHKSIFSLFVFMIWQMDASDFLCTAFADDINFSSAFLDRLAGRTVSDPLQTILTQASFAGGTELLLPLNEYLKLTYQRLLDGESIDQVFLDLLAQTVKQVGDFDTLRFLLEEGMQDLILPIKLSIRKADAWAPRIKGQSFEQALYDGVMIDAYRDGKPDRLVVYHYKPLNILSNGLDEAYWSVDGTKVMLEYSYPKFSGPCYEWYIYQEYDLESGVILQKMKQFKPILDRADFVTEVDDSGRTVIRNTYRKDITAMGYVISDDIWRYQKVEDFNFDQMPLFDSLFIHIWTENLANRLSNERLVSYLGLLQRTTLELLISSGYLPGPISQYFT